MLSSADLTQDLASILHLCRKTPGPGIRELYKFAPLHFINEGQLHQSLIRLLSERLLLPRGDIDDLYFLPSICDLTPKGAEFLRQFEADSDTGMPVPSLR